MPTANDDRFLLQVERTTDIAAAPKTVFDAVLEQLGTGSTLPDGKPFPMTFEAWPGGRWFRDLGNNAGHFWGHVQVIKPPALIEISGPMFMSYAATNHVKYRIEKTERGSMLTLNHEAVGNIHPEHRTNVTRGWDYILQCITRFATR